MKNKTTTGMRAGRKLNKILIYRSYYDMRKEFYRSREWNSREWKKPGSYSSFGMFPCCRAQAAKKWKNPKLIACKEPCGVCKAAGLQRGNESKKPKTGISAKQPNCTIPEFARVELMNNGTMIYASVPNDGCLHFTKGDFVDLKVMKVSRVSG